jgi:glycine betaine/proline transport system ATP-binding protein
VVENVAYGLKVQGVGKAQRRQKALQVLETVGLDSYWADALPSALSGGMQQRVGLARALATDADVLLMDEAFSALDPLIRRDMQDELIRLQADFHKTIVFISHDIHEALKIGDRVAVMKEGAVVQVADPETLIKAPADEYITAFMQDVNRAQVLTAGSIARQIPPIVLSQASVASALDHLHQYQRLHLHGVDDSGCPVGLLQRQDLEQAQGQTELAAVMQRQFPKVSQSIALEALFPLCQQGLPLAVIDAQGQWQGIIELTDVFASLT